jgi:hypothetical protein
MMCSKSRKAIQERSPKQEFNLKCQLLILRKLILLPKAKRKHSLKDKSKKLKGQK